jgi:hypothetical protein
LSTAEKIIFFLRGKKSSFFSEDQWDRSTIFKGYML